MKSYVFLAVFRKLEIPRKQDGSELLHDLDAAGSGGEFDLAASGTAWMKRELLARRNHAINYF